MQGLKFWFEELELGWQGCYQGTEGLWLRWYDKQGTWMPTADEHQEQEQQRAEQEYQRAEQERQLAERLAQCLHLAQCLRELGIDPDTV